MNPNSTLNPKDEVILDMSLRERFHAAISRCRTVAASGCWPWLGPTDDDGYGRIRLWLKGKGVNFKAHRVLWVMRFGAVPEGKLPDHTCRVRNCVNPDHLELVTNRENVVVRGVGLVHDNFVKTHCKFGHPLEGANLYRYRGGRFCKICRVRTNREWRHAKELAAAEALVRVLGIEALHEA